MVKLVPVKKISQLKLNKEKTAAEELEFLTWIIFPRAPFWTLPHHTIFGIHG